MIHFFKRIIYFIVPLVILVIASELFLRSIPNSYRYKDQWIKSHGGDVKTLIFGNSITYEDIVPSRLDSTFSLANVEQGLEYDNYLLKRYAPLCPNLKIVVLLIDDGNMYYQPLERDNSHNWHRCIGYKIYMEYPKHSFFSKYNFEISSPMSARNKLFNCLKSLVKGDKLRAGCDSLGGTSLNFNSLKMTMDESAAISYAKMRDSNCGCILPNIKYLEGIKNYCVEHNIRLILITPPKWRNASEHIPEWRWQQIYSYVNNLVDSNNKVEYHNYLLDERFCDNKDNFRDVTHLNNRSAEVFTKIIMEDLGI